MTKPVIYIAHPVSGDVRANIDKVLAWVRWFTEHDPTRVYIAPWVAEVLAFLGDSPDANHVAPDFYDRVLSDDEDVVRSLDGLVLTGVGTGPGPYRRENGMLKSTGMTREMGANASVGGLFIDMSQYATAEDAEHERNGWGDTGTDFVDMHIVRLNDVAHKALRRQ